MTDDSLPSYPMPLWVKIIIIAMALPALAFPWLLSLCPPSEIAENLVYFYPADAIACSICAWLAWRRRPYITWILLAVMLFTHVGIWLLVDPSIFNL